MNITKTEKNNDLEKKEISYKYNFQSIVKLTVLLTLAGIPLVFVPLGGNFDHFYFPKVIAIFILVLSFLIILLPNIKKIGRFIERDWINKILLSYFVLLIISLFCTENLELAIFGSSGRVEGIITIMLYMSLFIIARCCPSLNDKYFEIVLGTALIVSVYGICQTFGIDPFLRDELRVNWGSRAFATIGNPNFLGSYLVLMIPISMYLYVIKEKKYGLIGYTILFYCLLSTNTRGAWLGAIIAITSFAGFHLIYYKFNKKEFKRYLMLFFLSISIVLTYNYYSGGGLLSRFLTITSDAKDFLTNSENADYTGAHRGFIWKRVLELIERRPLVGYGIENLGETFNKYYSQDMIEFWGEVRYVDKAHNEYLNIAVTSGIPSLLSYLTFTVLIIKSGFAKLRRNPTMLMLLSSVLGYMAAAFFNISVVSVAYVFWIFLGMIASYNNKSIKL